MSAINEFLRVRLRTDDAKSLDDGERLPLSKDGVTVTIDEATYMRYLDLLPPRFMSGSLFAFAEGSGSFTLFWQHDRRYFAHQLSLADTQTFCRLSSTALHQ